LNLFVTGATGFIGKRVVTQLLKNHHTVTALLIPGEPEEGMEGCAISRGDITKPETLSGVMSGSEAVIHLAGAVGYGQTMARCLAINRDGTRNIAVESTRSGVRRFIHMSSVSVYGRRADVPIDENSPRQKIGDPYGDTKIDAELILQDLERQKTLELTIVRPTVIYGPGDVLFLPKLVENLRGGQARMIGSGANTVDLIHVDDVAEFFTILLANRKSIGRIYNLTHPTNPTWKEMLNFVTAELELPPVEANLPYPAAYLLAALLEFFYSFKTTPPRLTRYSVRVAGRQYKYLTRRACEELGYTPKIALFDGLRGCLAPFKKGLRR